jgi:methionine-gamma-lyase
MATMFLCNLCAGDCVLSHYSLYEGAHEFLYDILPKYGTHSLIADLRDINQLETIIKKQSSLKLIPIETPANPTKSCMDIEAIESIAK